MRLFLLKSCSFIPKLLFILRSTPLYNLNKLTVMDERLYDSLTSLLNIDLEQNMRKQISLPVKMGGFGIRSIKDLALHANLSSVYKSSRIMNISSPAPINPILTCPSTSNILTGRPLRPYNFSLKWLHLNVRT